MKLKERITTKLRAVKEESRRVKPLTYAEWLNDNGLTDNVENRALYGSYVLDVDNHNKKADMRLSQFIGRGVFLLCVLVVFVAMFINSVGATDIVYTDGVYDKNEITNSYQYTEACEFTWDGFDTSFTAIYLDFTNSSGYTYKMYIIENVELFYEKVDYYVQDKTQDDIFDFLYGYANDHPNSVDGYFGSEWYYGSPLQSLYYEYENQYNAIHSQGYDDGLDVGFDLGYDDGYDDGLDVGFDDGYDVGIQHGYDDGYDVGVREGYNLGYDAGVDVGETAKKSIFAIFDAPVKVLTSLLDFEIFGVNFLSIFKVILTVLLLGAIAKFVLSIAL